MKAFDEYIIVVLLVLSLKRVHFLVNQTERCDHSNESSRCVLSRLVVHIVLNRVHVLEIFMFNLSRKGLIIYRNANFDEGGVT